MAGHLDKAALLWWLDETGETARLAAAEARARGDGEEGHDHARFADALAWVARRAGDGRFDVRDDAFEPVFGAACTGVGTCSGGMWEDDGDERRGDGDA
jgi:hypothetical protein